MFQNSETQMLPSYQKVYPVLYFFLFCKTLQMSFSDSIQFKLYKCLEVFHAELNKCHFHEQLA